MNLDPECYQLPGSKIAMAFSDPAGTNSCIALFEMYRLQNKPLPQLFSNRFYFSSQYQPFVIAEATDFKQKKFDCLFTGTSHPESSDKFEVQCIKRAKASSVYVISFIDHWTNFKLRFEGLLKEEMPDEIWVVDEKAKQLAIEEGIDRNKIRIKGNPYHFYLQKYWHPEFTAKKYLEKSGIPPSFFYIVFAPDPLSLRNQNHQTGFTEAEALESILKILQRNQCQACLIIKLHPLQPTEILSAVLSKYENVNYVLLKQANNCELISASDLVIGFYSNFLLEAKALGKPVIRFFPGNIDADLLKYSEAIESPCRTETELESKILNYLHE
jgi:hypothetical protein